MSEYHIADLSLMHGSKFTCLDECFIVVMFFSIALDNTSLFVCLGQSTGVIVGSVVESVVTDLLL